MRWMPTAKVKTDADLAAVFPITPPVVEAIAESMRERGYDQAEPLVMWDGLVVDGHTRLAAAQQAGLEQVYVDEQPFEDKRAALEYAIRRQRDRRNLSRQELAGFVARAIGMLDRVNPRGGDRGNQYTGGKAPIGALPPGANGGKSAAETAAKIGVSARTVERTRVVMMSEIDGVKEALRNGQVTTNGAYQAVKQAEQAKQDSAPGDPLILRVQPALDTASSPEIRATYSAAEWQMLNADEAAAVVELAPLGSQATFNAQSGDNIEWARWSWNPITGCLHNCDYCYARDIAERFYAQKFVPTFIPSRLHAPRHTKLPKVVNDPNANPIDRLGWRNVFTCSMADLFGKWVPQAWIDAVFEEVSLNPQWNFLFLTKFPQRLAELEWPDNAWCGTSVDRQYRVEIAERSFRGVQAGVTWLSCEPLLERLTFSSLDMFDWIVIGASSRSSQTPEFQPPWEWVEHLLIQARAAGCRVYLKPNLKSRPREYPGEEAIRE